MEKFTITLSEQQVNIVLQSLAKMPLEQVLETFTEIKQQAEKQLENDESGNWSCFTDVANGGDPEFVKDFIAPT